ncbi:hypothetical protein [Methylobacterium nodulans]|uniref:Uncharacterized protein n=1 Tax=Methylobacterium nodulans (strain LMG 21967 / CNCM I-2342 / ORS 2060) TaxID=460265 RepID=B8IIK9_METNO|nr:hypothetical protein [Methylobacterium nodulans]ACL59886.1 conserved hypothetical protein [Methylobacterium nodulans ORS 2060]
MDWLQLAGQLAQVGLPSLGTLIGTTLAGPLGGGIGGALGKGAAAAIGAALGVPATPQAISQAVQADPTGAQLKLAEIDAAAKEQLAELADLANARQMQLGLAQASHWTASMPAIVTLAILAAWALLTSALYLIQGEIPERVYQLLSQAYGAANLALGTAIAFWLGSSRSSQQKDAQLSAILPSVVKR